MIALNFHRWIYQQGHEPEEFRKEAQRKVVFHAAVIVFLLWLLVFPTYEFCSTTFTGGSLELLPSPILMLINHSDYLRQYFYVVIASVMVALRCDYLVYIRLLNKSAAQWVLRYSYFVAFMLCIMCWIYLCSWMMLVRLSIEWQLIIRY